MMSRSQHVLLISQVSVDQETYMALRENKTHNNHNT